MEIFMQDISYSLTTHQVITHLAEILHSSPYSEFSTLPLNFHVYLFKDKRGTHKHSGKGALTLPTHEVGVHFLNDYGVTPFGSPRFCTVGQSGRRIKFSASRRTPRSDVIQSIRRRPYIDPKAMKEKEQREAFYDSEQVPITTIQFGWECRDSVFSIEWEETFQSCFLHFDANRRDFRLKISRPVHTLIIAVRLAEIRYISAHEYLQSEPVIFMSLDTPPAFELETIPPGTHRQRLSALPISDHERVAPYASLAMRLVCKSSNDLRTFSVLCKETKFHTVYDSEYPIDRRQLFSAHAINKLQHWLQGIDWCVAFQIESLVGSLVVDVQEMLGLLPNIQELINTKGSKYVASVLRHFRFRAKALFWAPDEMQDENIEQCFQFSAQEFAKQSQTLSLKPSEGSLFEALHVIITPTTMLFEGPFPERSNRVVRSYDPIHQESFLRVSFVDEARLQYRFDREVDGRAFVRARVGRPLHDGLTIAGRKFHFLAYSQSALKEHSVWFVKSFYDLQRGSVNAQTIIKSLGSFDKLKFDPMLIYCPARYAARISQAFTATDASITVEVEEVFENEDIKTESGNYCFTDGVGTLSKEMAVEITNKLKTTQRRVRNSKTPPRAFQVRFMGSKGMLSVDHKLSGRAICLTPSMIKFEAPESREIEIAGAFDRPSRYFLNRPLIMLLEGLGVPYEVFKSFQDRAVLETQQSVTSLAKAGRMLESYGLGTSYRLTSVMHNLEKLGIDNLFDDSFYRKMLEISVHHILRLLKNHARIPIPDAWTLVGVADIHKFLEEGQIFVHVKPQNGGAVCYLEGPVLVSRSPTIHPGDVQIAYAIGCPPPDSCFEKEPLTNTVVFSVKGSRPLPSCLGGGDLDGDVYNLIPLDKIPAFKLSCTHEPANYEPAKKNLLNRPSTMADVGEFVMEYINSDVVGIIAINWLIIADQSQSGIFDKDCLKLASLHSDAVDYPKSGQPVALTSIPKLKFSEKPDWNAPETVNPDTAHYYMSQRAVGKLFRAIQLPIDPHVNRRPRSHRPPRERTAEDLADALDHLNLEDDSKFDLVWEVVKDHVLQFINTSENRSHDNIQYVQQIFSRYCSEFQAICAAHTLSHTRITMLTEEEAVVGTIIQKTSQPRKRKDMMARLREQTDILVRGVREELAGDADMTSQEYLRRAWLAWDLSMVQPNLVGARSFWWVALGAIFEATKEIEEELIKDARNRFY